MAVVQAVMFGISVAHHMDEAGGIGDVALQAVFAVLVVGLDLQVLWAVRKRLRDAAATDPI
jgi:hypothetical protein